MCLLTVTCACGDVLLKEGRFVSKIKGVVLPPDSTLVCAIGGSVALGAPFVCTELVLAGCPWCTIALSVCGAVGMYRRWS